MFNVVVPLTKVAGSPHVEAFYGYSGTALIDLVPLETFVSERAQATLAQIGEEWWAAGCGSKIAQRVQTTDYARDGWAVLYTVHGTRIVGVRDLIRKRHVICLPDEVTRIEECDAMPEAVLALPAPAPRPANHEEIDFG